MRKTAGYAVMEGIPVNIPTETHVIVQNGVETQLRVTMNNNDNGLVEVEFYEVQEAPFRYPLQNIG